MNHIIIIKIVLIIIIFKNDKREIIDEVDKNNYKFKNNNQKKPITEKNEYDTEKKEEKPKFKLIYNEQLKKKNI